MTRGIHSSHFSADWFDHAGRELLDADKIELGRQATLEARDATVNSDWKPAAYFYHLVIWDEMTGGRSRAVLGALKSLQTTWGWLVALPPIFGGLWLGWVRLRRGAGRWLEVAAVTWSTASTGFAGISIELVLLFAFQSLYGYVYQRIGLIVALFMFGLAAGALVTRRWSAKHEVRPRQLALLDLVITLMLALTPVVLMLAGRLSGSAPALAETVIMAEVVASGVLAGMAFPLAVVLYRHSAARAGRTAGAVAGADNVGACAGALLAGVALVPVVGMVVTCLMLAWLKLTSVALLSAWSLRRSG